jgi:CRP/FNR family transcriptional regulator, polysaccharide utilization system transcription regulator
MESCKSNCATCLKVNFSLFKGLSESELTILNEGREKLFFDKGEVIYKEGATPQGLLCLTEGKVKLSKVGKIENEFIVGLHKPVDFIGFDDLLGGRNYTSSAIALENVALCLIDKKNLFRVIKDNSDFALKIIQNFSEQVESYKEKLINLTQKQIDERLAFALNELIEFFGFEKDGKTLAIQIKRREIAAISNMNTANVIRTLAKFKEEKIIDTVKKSIVILDKDKLLSLL